MIVVGENASKNELEVANDINSFLENATGNRLPEEKCSEVLKEGKNNNLIIVGTPESNKMIREVYRGSDVFKINETFPSGKGLIEILDNPWNMEKTILLVQGSNLKGLGLASERLIKDSKGMSENYRIVTEVSREEAIKAAKAHLKEEATLKDSELKITEYSEYTGKYYIPTSESRYDKPKLCWDLYFYSPQGRVTVYVNATTKDVIGTWIPE